MDHFALRKAAQRALANVTPIQTPIESLPFADASVDFVFSTFGVEHLYDPKSGTCACEELPSACGCN